MKNKVLIIDDDVVTSEMLKMRLEKRGLEVDIVSGDERAIKVAVETSTYSVSLLGETLSDLNVFDTITLIRSIADATILPIILLTSSSDYVSGNVKILDLGINDFIAKPINIDVAVARINNHIQMVKLNLDIKNKGEMDILNAMIATYNHEINNPLAIAVGYIDILINREGTDNKMYNAISKALDRITKIIRDIENLNSQGSVQKVNYVDVSKMLDLTNNNDDE